MGSMDEHRAHVRRALADALLDIIEGLDYADDEIREDIRNDLASGNDEHLESIAGDHSVYAEDCDPIVHHAGQVIWPFDGR